VARCASDHEIAQPAEPARVWRSTSRPLVGCIRCTGTGTDATPSPGVRARRTWPGHEQGALLCPAALVVFVRQTLSNPVAVLAFPPHFVRSPSPPNRTTAMSPHPALLARVLYSYPLSPIPRRRTSYNCISSASARAATLINHSNSPTPTPHERFSRVAEEQVVIPSLKQNQREREREETEEGRWP
jgi:hypothetical protein